MTHAPPDDPSLDPDDWAAYRASLHRVLDASLDRLESTADGPVWQAPTDDLIAAFQAPLPQKGIGAEAVQAAMLDLLPYGVGNTHPRFFGWVHGSGSPGGLPAAMVEAAMNANCGGRNHGAIHVERQVIEWSREVFGFPETTSGLIVTGTSLATLVALKVARDAAVDFSSRTDGAPAKRVGYTSAASHSCVGRAFDMLGLGTEALRTVPVNLAGQMDIAALQRAISEDREAGLAPFAVIATAGTVNRGATDDMAALADLADAENLWLHVDGAFGALAKLSPAHAPRLKGIERADSLAFDFHKWLHVNYDAGCVLVRDGAAHVKSWAVNPDYLTRAERGTAAGEIWPVDLGPDLSRGFRALKVWAQIAEHGTEKLGKVIARNCDQAAHLGTRVEAADGLALLAPVQLNICCFRAVPGDVNDGDLDRLNAEIVMTLQEQGLAVPSTTRIDGVLAIRVNLTNYRTRYADLDNLVAETLRLSHDRGVRSRMSA